MAIKDNFLIEEKLFSHLFSGSKIFVPEAVDDAHECKSGGNDDKALKRRKKVVMFV
jgi:hypothetical protein